MFGLSSLAVKAIVLSLTLASGFAAGMHLESRLAEGRYKSLELTYAQAQTKALEAARAEQTRLDAIASASAQREAAAQAQIAATTRRQLAEVQKHVKEISHCLPVGYIRVLYAAANGRLASSLSPAAGKSDDSCAPVGWSSLFRGLVLDYGSARANIIQLDALIKFYRDAKK